MLRRVVSASTVGTALEWYDFTLYGTAAALVFGKVFFSSQDPLVGTLASFATFAVGFVARPIGGVLFGSWGDRSGRKLMLVVTLSLMAASSTLIGLLPDYDTIGVAAPIVLVVLRVLQGLGSGAEFAGSTLMAAEHAPDHRRGLFAAIPAAGNAMGVILASAVFTPFTLLPDEQFLSWGWRVPFLLSVVIVGVGLYIRLRVPESPAFESTRQAGATASLPLATAVRTAPRRLGLAFLANIGPNVASYVPAVFALSYIANDLGLPESVGTVGLLIANLVKLVTLPLCGALSDRFGRRPVFISGALLCAVLAFPFFWLLDTEHVLLIWLALTLVLTISNDMMLGPQASMLAEQFDTRTRYTGVAVTRELAGAAVGGTLPFAATAILGATGGASWGISVLMIGLSVLAALGAFLLPETAGGRLVHKEVSAGPEPDVAEGKG